MPKSEHVQTDAAAGCFCVVKRRQPRASNYGPAYWFYRAVLSIGDMSATISWAALVRHGLLRLAQSLLYLRYGERLWNHPQQAVRDQAV